jgi:hypothetical protein
MEFAFLSVAWLACGFGAMAIADAKKLNGCAWFLIGVMMGPIGLLIAIGMPNQATVRETGGARMPCPSCAELIQPAAVRCRFCGHDMRDASA